ncbi:unnamed protein product [Bursaphelenchus okinawaensis]|uniref:ShKT domain-containing protein n=1 Tax=Bursaphelenchus okinawaensis TaxID=465554 RepID=A0A811K3A7_9BILA|nr:unnamed protein product [Bursaphelenchus okinawaensis]CAG9089700.1 unnamed protein product [Bursaphelenchus okinawaensis]
MQNVHYVCTTYSRNNDEQGPGFTSVTIDLNNDETYVVEYDDADTETYSYTSTDCEDKLNDCDVIKEVCYINIYYKLMKGYCAKTCLYCGAGSCTDKANDCPEKTQLCNQWPYTNLMEQLCPKSCKLCNVECGDTDPNCKEYVENNFCQNAYYPTSFIKGTCGTSCKMC